MRFFRRDGHNWRKKKDGRTVGEAHELLKLFRITDVLLFHGRAYEHIVLVHYRETNPPVPQTYFGNCIGARIAFAKTREFLDEDGGVVVAVESLSFALETLKDGVLNEAKTWSSFLHDGLYSDEEMKITGATGTQRFEVYGSDFGWGRPKKVDMVSIDRPGAIFLSDSRDGDGLDSNVIALLIY
ncbi:hypothetical protein HN51_001108 [Arachis hypogaea]